MGKQEDKAQHPSLWTPPSFTGHQLVGTFIPFLHLGLFQMKLGPVLYLMPAPESAEKLPVMSNGCDQIWLNPQTDSRALRADIPFHTLSSLTLPGSVNCSSTLQCVLGSGQGLPCAKCYSCSPQGPKKGSSGCACHFLCTVTTFTRHLGLGRMFHGSISSKM